MKRYIKASGPVIVDDRDFVEDLVALAETVGEYNGQPVADLLREFQDGRYESIDNILQNIRAWIEYANMHDEDPDTIGYVLTEWKILYNYRNDDELFKRINEDYIDNTSDVYSSTICASEYVVMVRNRGMWGYDTYCKDEQGRPMKFRTREQAQAVADRYNSDRGPVNNFNQYYVEEW